MASYTRGTIWSDGAYLTSADLNAEFDRIAAVLNGGLEVDNFLAGEVESPIVVNAGAPRFQTGSLDAAELVAAAIAEAVAGNIKTVLVPRTLFGYAGETGFSPAIFDTTIHMVREGAFGPGHDVVAYGAKPGDALVDDAPSFQAAQDAAAASAIGSNPGHAFVVASLPGEYQLDSDVVLTAGVGYVELPGVTLAGVGGITSATTGVSKQGVYPFRGLVNQVKTAAPGLVNILASATNTGAANFGNDMADWMLVLLEVSVVEDVAAAVIGSGLAGMQVNTANGITTIIEVLTNTTNTLVNWSTQNTDGGSAHDFTVELTAYFVKKEAL